MNSLTHGVAAALSIAALTVLVVFSSLQGDPWKIVSFSIYGATLIALYTASTVYHAVPSPRIRPFLRRIDHSCIYLLIAGTYTPFMLVVMRDAWGWTLFGLVCSAVLGTCSRSLTGRYEVVSTLWYIMMGGSPSSPLNRWLICRPASGRGWSEAGWPRSASSSRDGKLRYNHAVWHCFVLGGSLLRFVSFRFRAAEARGNKDPAPSVRPAVAPGL